IFQLMRDVDMKYAQEPDIYIANSSIVARRIEKIYGKQAIMINYPIDTSNFVFSDTKDEYYLASARMISYKRLDIIVEAFNWLGWPLIISGDGPERDRLQSKALDNIQFVGHVSDSRRKELFSKAKSIIVAALEDYGLVPVEANASGTPVVAFGAGGVLDTQIHGKTGVFFNRQTPESLQMALLESGEITWNYENIRNHAVNNFSEPVFFSKVERIIDQTCSLN
ncbi:glycosyltransferase, partial [Nostoc sp. NIES-2111]